MSLMLTLDQHIGVRIPGGQPNQINNLATSIPPKTLSRTLCRTKSRTKLLVNPLESPSLCRGQPDHVFV